jgi:predicted transcriptional regulator
MEVHFTPEIEAIIKRLAASAGRDAEQLVLEIVESHLNHDLWFRQEVQKGLDQLGRGESISHDEVFASIERMFNR